MNYVITVVGGSRGASRALATVLAGLPRDFPLAVAVALHRDRHDDDELLGFLRQRCALPIREAEAKQAIIPGHVYLAPRDYHLLVEEGSLALSTEAPVNAARPSIDVLFESAAEICGPQAIAVILSGTGVDGAQGLVQIRKRGGLAVVQDPGEAEFRAMPETALAAAGADRILPLAEIAPFLALQCRL